MLLGSWPASLPGHIDDVIEVVEHVYKLRENLRGFLVIGQTPVLRHVTIEFEPAYMKDPSFLKVMVQKAHARLVLEIGTSDGTSALAMAEMLPEDGTVLTCEINVGLAALARKRLGRSPHGRKVEVLVGPAMETLPTLTGPFDLIFVDADTRNYVHYYRSALELLAPTGVLIMDNTQGMAIGPVDHNKDPAIAAIQELARLVQSDTRVSAQLIGVRDGVLVVTWAAQASRTAP